MYLWKMHDYLGPIFSWDHDQRQIYEAIEEDDPIWPLFSKWLEKYESAKESYQVKSKLLISKGLSTK